MAFIFAINEERLAEQNGDHRGEANGLRQGKAPEQNELPLSVAVCFFVVLKCHTFSFYKLQLQNFRAGGLK